MTGFGYLIALAALLFIIDALGRMADERRRLDEDRRREQRIAAGRARAQREYEARVRAGRGR